jgi:cytochrome c oxidase subunit 1
MPRRYYAHLPQYHLGHVIASIGAFLMVTGIFIYVATLIAALFKGTRAPQNPWGGRTLEWMTSTPPPTENFKEIPVITGRPYEFNPEESR